MQFDEEWVEPIRRECGAMRRKQVADGVLFQVCTLKMGHAGDHDPLGGTSVTTPLTTGYAGPFAAPSSS